MSSLVPAHFSGPKDSTAVSATNFLACASQPGRNQFISVHLPAVYPLSKRSTNKSKGENKMRKRPRLSLPHSQPPPLLRRGIFHAAAKPAPRYHVIKTVSVPAIRLGLCLFRSDGARLYLATDPRVVMNADTYAIEGDIPIRPGVHASQRSDLGRGSPATVGQTLPHLYLKI